MRPRSVGLLMIWAPIAWWGVGAVLQHYASRTTLLRYPLEIVALVFAVGYVYAAGRMVALNEW